MNSFPDKFLHNEVLEYKRNFDLSKIKNLIIVGSTCVGKSTIVDAVRSCESLQEFVSVPKRCITRPARSNDNLVENKHVSPDDFSKKVEDGSINLNWIRKMDGNREEKYGFESSDKDQITIYSGNNALYDNRESVSPENIFDDSLIVGIYAPDKIRKERLGARSPDLVKNKPEEVAYRLSDSSVNMLPHVDVIINNFGTFEKEACAAMINFVKKIVDAKIL